MKFFVSRHYIVWVLLAAVASCILRANVREAGSVKTTLLRTGTPTPTTPNNSNNTDDHESNVTATAAAAATKDPLSLYYGDLPGYTGWNRPVRSTAAWYDVSSSTAQEKAIVGVPFVWTVHCRHVDCQSMEALFDTRAYGPAILPGLVQSHHNGSYSVTMLFHDPGEYVVEIVLAFSNVAPLSTFPVVTTPEPAYEGYLLPGFPRTVQVVSNQQHSTTTLTTSFQRRDHVLPLCTADNMLESNTTSALSKARWKITKRVRGSGHLPNPWNRTTFAEYRYGLGSIGFQADYFYNDCRLEALSSLMNQTLHMPDRRRSMIVFIGDSHMRKQHKLFDELFGKVLPSLYLKTNDGLLVRLPEIREALQGLTKSYHENKLVNIYIIFNAGLHEVDILCSQERVNARQRVIAVPDANFSCTDQYRANLNNLTELVLGVPSALRVFQSTSAGWLRWGNFGFAWNPNRIQNYPAAPQACADLNAIAYEVMKEYGIPVMDSFWVTRARYDHREIDMSNDRGKKMVHSGEEVNEVLLREWLSLVLQNALRASSSHETE